MNENEGIETAKICMTCDNWKFVPKAKGPKGEQLGECRRYPPTVFPMASGQDQLGRMQITPINLRPTMPSTETCGEWELRASKAPAFVSNPSGFIIAGADDGDQ
jgi:hypothetical protein